MPYQIASTTQIIGQHFLNFYRSFEKITSSAKKRFVERDWEGQRIANGQRISLHKQAVEAAYQALIDQDALPPDQEKVLSQLLDHFIPAYANQSNAILAYGFVDSLLRKILYRHKDFEQVYTTREYPFEKEKCRELVELSDSSLLTLLTEMFRVLQLGDELSDPNNLLYLEAEFSRVLSGYELLSLSFLPHLFFRNQHAYLVGRIRTHNEDVPFAIALINPQEGIMADALLTSEEDIKRIFAFSRSYLLTNTQDPWGTIHFLMQMMPSKTEEQLIINLGYLDAGRHRMLQKLKVHLRNSPQKFDYAPGIPGMVMLVFNLPDYPLVLKLIRDHIRPPKSIRKEQVLSKYDFVARHDRAGRLADVQLYEYLVLPISSFDEKLLTDLKEQTADSVLERGDFLILKQVFIERKMRPLNIFLQEANEEAKVVATLDYGKAIKEMAMINIFPGDLLIKNFGVTSDQRVVFYDYDEVCTLQDCEFRTMPEPCYEDEIMSAEPWFSVNENDVFPEEFASFVVPKGPLFDLLKQHHPEIFEADFWNYWKSFYASGKVLDLQPYEHSRVEQQKL